MATTGKSSVLKRKLANAGSNDTVGERPASRALRLALARDAASLFDLPLAVIGTVQGRPGNNALTQLVPESNLLLLDGHDGQVGAAALDMALVEALIQQQTMGTISARPGEPRAFTFHNLV